MSGLDVRQGPSELDFLALGALVHRLDPGVLLCTMLSSHNTTAAPGLDRFDPDHYRGRRLDPSVELATPELVSTFGHGVHRCPAARFSISAANPELHRQLLRAVDAGIRTYVVSWRNPDKSLAHMGWKNYLELGPLSATRVASSIADVPDVNMIGYCIGGTLTAEMLAYLARSGETLVKSVTFFAALTAADAVFLAGLGTSRPGSSGVTA